MHLQIDKHASTPISRQIAEQIRAQCLTGILEPGEQIESVRQLATRLAVNPNTVLRVYEKLTAEGLLERRHGAGTFVANLSQDEALQAQREQFKQDWHQLAQRGRMLGFTPEQLAALTASAPDSPKPPTPHSDSAPPSSGVTS